MFGVLRAVTYELLSAALGRKIKSTSWLQSAQTTTPVMVQLD
jgi:hypothetical protein